MSLKSFESLSSVKRSQKAISIYKPKARSNSKFLGFLSPCLLGTLPCKSCCKWRGLVLWPRLTVLLDTAGDVDAGVSVSGDQGGEQPVGDPGDGEQ